MKDKAASIRDVVTVRNENLNVLRVQDNTKFQDERMGGTIFTIDGVTFGLEICLDHAASCANHTAGRLDNAASIQVHLIPSAGMGIRKLRAVPGGIVFNVDGSTPHVQVVAGLGTKQEIRFDPVDVKGKPWHLRLPRRLAWKDIDSMDNLIKANPLDQWSRPTFSEAPRVSGGLSGSVLLYGPYDLP